MTKGVRCRTVPRPPLPAALHHIRMGASGKRVEEPPLGLCTSLHWTQPLQLGCTEARDARRSNRKQSRIVQNTAGPVLLTWISCLAGAYGLNLYFLFFSSSSFFASTAASACHGARAGPGALSGTGAFQCRRPWLPGTIGTICTAGESSPHGAGAHEASGTHQPEADGFEKPMTRFKRRNWQNKPTW